MADNFIGLRVLVTLKSPANAQVMGTVSVVAAGQGVTLSNVRGVDTPQPLWVPEMTIRTDNVADIAEIRDPISAPTRSNKSPLTTTTNVPSFARDVAAPTLAMTAPQNYRAVPRVSRPTISPIDQPQQPASSSFVDPAILSIGKRPGSVTMPGPEKPQLAPALPSRGRATPIAPPLTELPVIEAWKDLGIKNSDKIANPSHNPGTQEASHANLKKAKRRNRAKDGRKNGTFDEAEASPQQPRTNQAVNGKGWRNTPILQSTASFQPFKALKKSRSQGQANDNGWASEDVTDMQEMGDFDFEGNNTKFDKRNLFEQMRKDDQTDDAARLVSHNRQPRPKPGTAGGKNLHYTENVLDLPSSLPKSAKETSNDFWNSEADDGESEDGERPSGREPGHRHGSRHGESKVAATRRSRSRKASAQNTGPIHRIGSGIRQTNRGSRPNSRLEGDISNKGKQFSAGLYAIPSNRRVEYVSPLQALNLENVAHNEIGLTEAMMTENAGRGIAEVTLKVLDDPAIKVRHAGSADANAGVTPSAMVVILAGNHKSGMRAIAGARHLRHKGVNVLVCMVGIERGEQDLLDDVRQQMRVYKACGGHILTKADLFEHIRKISIPTLTIDTPRSSALSSLANPAPVTLIVDALLGLAIPYEELRAGDQATTYELMEWANRNEAFVLSIDVPTGVDPSSGKVSTIDGSPLYVKPRYVVAMGAPKRGLFEAIVVSAGGVDDASTEWKLFVADMGLGAAVWKKAGAKVRRGINFDDKWVIEMRYRGETD